MTAAPDFASAVAGYRAWQLGPGGVLFPLALPAAPPWDPTTNRARCFARCADSHTAPGPRCTCGFHALHDPSDGRLGLGHPAVGAIAAWGEIEVYAAGFRAEYAAVVALARPPSSSGDPSGPFRDAARRYGVRIVPYDRLEAEAGEFALPLPDVLRRRALNQPDVRKRGALTDARGSSIRMLEWAVGPDTPLDDFTAAKKANPGSWITKASMREQRDAVDELHYRRFHLNQWTSRIGSRLPTGA